LTDAYDHWRRRLAGEDVGMKDGEPQAGYYRSGDVPVAIVPEPDAPDILILTWGTAAKPWRTDNRLKVEMGWERLASAKPVTYEDYLAAYNGEPWPDQNAVVHAAAKEPEPVTAEDYSARIARLADEGNRLIADGGAKSQEAADRAGLLVQALQRLENATDEKRKAEKEPHMEAARAVDERWRPLTAAAANVKRDVKARVLTPWLHAEEERLKAEAAMAKKAAAAVGEAPPVVSTRPKATRGSVGLTTRKVAVVVDRRQTLKHYLERNEDLPGRLMECLDTLAQAAATAGITLPGYDVMEVKSAR
jgi:hypothetical protein